MGVYLKLTKSQAEKAKVFHLLEPFSRKTIKFYISSKDHYLWLLDYFFDLSPHTLHDGILYLACRNNLILALRTVELISETVTYLF